MRGRVARTGPGACREKGRLLQNYRGVLTADFHAAESRGLRHWFAALREGCGPGPTRHDPIPLILSGLWETVTCYTAGLVASPNLLIQKKKRMTVNEQHYNSQGGQAERDPLYPAILHSSSYRLINYPFFPTNGQSEHHFFLIFQVFFQRAFEDTSPTKIVMNLASPCGPPIKTN